MGKGDKKTAKGKRSIGSFGVSRNRKKIKARLKRAASAPKSAATKTEKTKARRTPKKKADA